jgi:hypothetical protein
MEVTEATQALEGIKSLSTGESTLDVQAIAEAAAARIVEALSTAPKAEPLEVDEDADLAEQEKALNEFDEADAVSAGVVSGKTPTTVSAPETPLMPQVVLLPAEPILLSAEVVSLLRASLKAGLTDVTCHVLSVMLKD